MAGSKKRSTRSKTAAAASSSCKKKLRPTRRRGSQSQRDDNTDNNRSVEDTTEEIMPAAPLPQSSSGRLRKIRKNNYAVSTAAAAASSDGDDGEDTNKEGGDNNISDDTKDTKPSSSSNRPQQRSSPPPAKIKGRFMEVKMKQLTSYFSRSNTPNSEVGGVEEEGGEEERGDHPNNMMKKEEEEDLINNENHHNKDDDDHNETKDSSMNNLKDGGSSSSIPPTTTTTTAASSCPLSLLASAISSASYVTTTTSTQSATDGGAIKADEVHIDQSQSQQCDDQAAEAETKEDGDVGGDCDGAEVKNEVKPQTTQSSSSIDEDNDVRVISRDTAADAADDGREIMPNQQTSEEGGQHKINSDESPTLKSSTIAIAAEGEAIITKEKCVVNKAQSSEQEVIIDGDITSQSHAGKGNNEDVGTTLEDGIDNAMEHGVPMKNNTSERSLSQSHDEQRQLLTTDDNSKEQLLRGEEEEEEKIVDAMETDVSTENIVSEERPSRQDGSDDTVDNNEITMSDGQPLTLTSSSPNKSEFDNTQSPPQPTTIPTVVPTTPSVDQLKMALFLEASRVHTGSGPPERIFANYWDALEKFISSPGVSSNPSLTLERFLKTRKMKRLHNKLVLAIITDSVREYVSMSNSDDCIPDVWRNQALPLHLKSGEGAEQQRRQRRDDMESDYSLRNDWNASFGSDSDVWSSFGNINATIAPKSDHHHQQQQKQSITEESERDDDESSYEEIIPSCRLPGSLDIDLFVKKSASDAGLTVSNDSLWLLIVAAREYASKIVGLAIENDKAVSSGQTTHIPKSEHSSLSCEHLLKSSKKKDSKTNETVASKDEKSNEEVKAQYHDSCERKKKRRLLTCADISQVLLDHPVAAPRLALMRSMGRGAAHHEPDLGVTNSIINSSIQSAARKRRRIADRDNTGVPDVSVVPTAIDEETRQHDAAPKVNNKDAGDDAKGGFDRNLDVVVENRPSCKINDSTTAAPPKSSDMLKANAVQSNDPGSPRAPGISDPSEETNAIDVPATAKITQIRQPGRFGAKNLAAMKARRGSSFLLNESADNVEEETEKSVQPMNRQQSEVTGPATQAVLQQHKPPVASNTSQLWEETAKSMQSQIQEQEEPQKKPPATSKTAALWQESEQSIQSKMEQEKEQVAQHQPNPATTQNTAPLWDETGKELQSQSPQEDENVINPAKQSTTPLTQNNQQLQQTSQHQPEQITPT